MEKMSMIFNSERHLIFDESGNLGKDGRYFVIACIDTDNVKELHNIMKRKIEIARLKFPTMKTHTNEIKASEAFPCVKYHLLECIAKKNIKISYIVADLKYVEDRLLEDKNIFYNYIEVMLTKELIRSKDFGNKINIISDSKTTKVTSVDSFAGYLKAKINYEMNINVELNVKYLDSNAKDAYIVQAADYVANAIYAKYEYGQSLYFDILKNSFEIIEEFPRDKFGK